MTNSKTNKNLVAVVVTYNRLEKLKQTLARLLETSAVDLKAVVVVDNASTDGTQEWLAQIKDARLICLRERTNSGGAGGFSKGMREAVDRFDPDWLVVMDDDGRPETGALERFQELDVTPWDGIAASVFYPSGEICEMNRPSRNPFWHSKEFGRAFLRGRKGFHIQSDAYSEKNPSAIDVTSFVGFFLSRRGIELAGFPDPQLFIYGDDGIYTLGLTEKGGKICFDPRIRFEHDTTSFASEGGRLQPLWKVYYYHRNLLLLYRLAAGIFLVPALFVIIPKWLFNTGKYKGKRRVFLGLLLRAVRDGLLNRRSVSHEDVMKWADADS